MDRQNEYADVAGEKPGFQTSSSLYTLIKKGRTFSMASSTNTATNPTAYGGRKHCIRPSPDYVNILSPMHDFSLKYYFLNE